MASRTVRLSCLLGLALVVVNSGCSHTLGAAPTDLDLRNDGSPQARSHLFSTYQVTYGDGSFRRPASRELVTDASSDEAANYINTSEPAREQLETGPVALDRFMHSGSLYTVTAGLGMTIGLVTGLSATVPAAFDAVATDRAAAPGEALTVSKTAALGALVGAVAAIPMVWLIDLTINPVVRSVAASDYRRAAQTFNSDLQRRIEKAADPKLVPKAGTDDEGVDL